MVKIPPVKGVKWTLWWGALDYLRFRVRGLKLSKGVRGGKWKTSSMNTKSCYWKRFYEAQPRTSNFKLQTNLACYSKIRRR